MKGSYEEDVIACIKVCLRKQLESGKLLEECQKCFNWLQNVKSTFSSPYKESSREIRKIKQKLNFMC